MWDFIWILKSVLNTNLMFSQSVNALNGDLSTVPSFRDINVLWFDERTLSLFPENNDAIAICIPVTNVWLLVWQIFDYTELSQAQAIIPVSSPIEQPGSGSNSGTASNTSGTTPAVITKGSGGRRSWHEYGRNSEIDKIQIPKMYYFFKSINNSEFAFQSLLHFS